MIIYGTRATSLQASQLPNAVCPHCNTTGSVTVAVYARYAHIFWIPFFSIGKTGVAVCHHCNQVTKKDQMQGEILSAYYRLSATGKTPIWHFAGMGVIALLFAFSIYSSGVTSKKEQAYFEKPAVGDVYEYMTNDNFYSMFRVVGLGNDTLFVRYNSKAVNKSSGLYRIDREEEYASDTTALPKSELTTMRTAGEIYHIRRND